MEMYIPSDSEITMCDSLHKPELCRRVRAGSFPFSQTCVKSFCVRGGRLL